MDKHTHSLKMLKMLMCMDIFFGKFNISAKLIFCPLLSLILGLNTHFFGVSVLHQSKQ